MTDVTCDAADCDEPIVHTKTRVAIFGHRAWTSPALCAKHNARVRRYVAKTLGLSYYAKADAAS